MPSPKKHEKKNNFIRRCIHELVHSEGKEPQQALAICYTYWNDRAKKGLDEARAELQFYHFIKGQSTEVILAVCPKCGLVLDYTAHKEAGSGHIKCPSCQQEVTQEHIREVN